MRRPRARRRPETGHQIVARTGRYGPYVTEVLDEGTKEKPRTASLFKSMSLDTVTLEEALKLLSLPRVVGESDGEEITRANGRYGPYVKKGKDRGRSRPRSSSSRSRSTTRWRCSRSRSSAGGRRPAKPPLKELGADPVSGKPIVVKDGRFGPYVTDGETNASLRSGDDPEEITLERALELLADRRARGPAKKPQDGARSATSRKRTS